MAANQPAPAAPAAALTCTSGKVDFKNILPNYNEESSFFFGICEQIMKVFMSTIDERSYEVTAKAILGDVDVGGLLKQYAVVTGVVAVLLLLTLGSLLTFIICFGKRWLSRNDTEITPRTGHIISQYVFMVFSTLFCVFGCVIYFISFVYLKDGVMSTDVFMESTMTGVNTFINNYGTSVKCSLAATTVEIKKDLPTALQATTDNLNGIVDALIDIKSIKKTLNNLNSGPLQSLINKQMQVLDKKIDEINDRLQMSKQKITSDMATVKKKLDQTFDFIDKIPDKLDSVLKTVTDAVDGVKKNMHVKLVEYNVANYATILTVFTFFPILLPAFIIFTAIVLFFRFLTKTPSTKRGIVSRFAGTIIGAGGHISMFTSFLFWLLSTMFFFLAFLALFLCLTLFRDDKLTVLNRMPSSITSYTYQIHGRDINLDIKDLLYRCKTGSDFFEAIDGQAVLAEKELKKNIDTVKLKRDFASAIYALDFKPQLKEIAKSRNEMRTAIRQYLPGQLQNPELLEFEAVYNQILLLQGNRVRDKLVASMETSIDNLVALCVQSLTKILEAILDRSGQCKELVDLWSYIGDFICQNISQPAQGFWIATVFIAVGAILVVHTMFTSTAYLKAKKSDNDTPDEKEETKKKSVSKEPVSQKSDEKEKSDDVSHQSKDEK